MQKFQSTRPRGARPFIQRLFCEFLLFQSTRPRGARLLSNCRRGTFFEFQSTRPRGARLLSNCRRGTFFEFQSTRPRGARPILSKFNNLVKGFNPRAHGGRDPATCGVTDNVLTFQSTRPRGARHEQDGVYRRSSAVSIHAPTGGATSIFDSFLFFLVVSIHAPTGGAT